MKTITKTFNIYTFSELSPKAQQKVLDNWLDSNFYPWEDENTSTLEAFCKIFPCTWKEYTYYPSNITASVDIPDNIDDLSPLRLRTYILNNYSSYLFKPKYLGSKKAAPQFTPIYSKISKSSDCPLTGYWLDDEILSPLYAFLKKPYSITFTDLLTDCLNSFLSAIVKEYDYYTSPKGIQEDIEANGYHFLENGDIYHE